MRGTFQVIGLTKDEFTTKAGRAVTNHLLVMMDADTPPMLSTVDFLLNEEQKLQFGDGKLTGQKCQVVISDMEQSFNGRLRVTKGSIQPVNGK